jgi:hypothetical protein
MFRIVYKTVLADENVLNFNGGKYSYLANIIQKFYFSRQQKFIVKVGMRTEVLKLNNYLNWSTFLVANIEEN